MFTTAGHTTLAAHGRHSPLWMPGTRPALTPRKMHTRLTSLAAVTELEAKGRLSTYVTKEQSRGHVEINK